MYKRNISLTGCNLKAFTFCMIFPFFDYRLFLWTLNQSKEQKPIASLKLFHFISGSRAASAHTERRQSPRSAFYSNDESVGRSRELHEFPGQCNCFYLKPIFFTQMTKVLDVLESFMNFQVRTYLGQNHKLVWYYCEIIPFIFKHMTLVFQWKASKLV